LLAIRSVPSQLRRITTNWLSSP